MFNANNSIQTAIAKQPGFGWLCLSVVDT